MLNSSLVLILLTLEQVNIFWGVSSYTANRYTLSIFMKNSIVGALEIPLCFSTKGRIEFPVRSYFSRTCYIPVYCG